MKRFAMVVASLIVALPGVAFAQAPQIQNGKVETRKAAAIDREIASLPARADDATWVAWKVPMIDGDRDVCSSWYNDRFGAVRGMFIDDSNMSIAGGALVPNPRPQITPPTGPIPIEAGTNAVMLVRVISGKVERLRTIGDDCPVDAGGRTVVWLDGVTPAESLRYLATLVRGVTPEQAFIETERNLADSAVQAIAYHRDPAADTALEQIAADHRDSNVRRQAASRLGSLRGAKGVASLSRMLAAEKNVDARRALVTAIGGSRNSAAVDALRGLTKDPEAKVRSEAVYYFVLRGGAAVVPEALKFVSSDADESIRKRAVTAIGRLPADASTAPLLQIARTSDNAAVKKEAVSILSQSKDPRAIAYIDEILKK